MSSGDGILLAEVIDEFTSYIREIGPLGTDEGEDENGLKVKLEAAKKLVPYIRLVERERLRITPKSEDAYTKFFTGDEFDGLFNDLIVNKLAISEIMLLLEEKPLSTGEISEVLGLEPSEVSRHMNSSSRHGFVRYDVNSKCYARA
jgi:DNA-binding transcriptional ArsR family regulator